MLLDRIETITVVHMVMAKEAFITKEPKVFERFALALVLLP